MRFGPVRFGTALVILCASTLISCTKAWVERFEAPGLKYMTPPQDEAFARRWVQYLRDGAFDEIERGLDRSLRTDDLRDKLNAMAQQIPIGNPTSVKVSGYTLVKRLSPPNTISITLEYKFPGQWLVATLVKQQAESAIVTNFNIRRFPDSEQNYSGFTLIGKGSAQYIVFMLALAALATSIYGFILALRTSLGGKKWLWALACLIGVGKLGVNWTTGEVSFMPILIGVPTSDVVMAGLYTPWVVYVSVPIGAILFFVFRNRLVRARASALVQHSPAAPSGGVLSPPDESQ